MTCYLVIGVNQDEFGRGIDRPVHTFKTEAEMTAYVTQYNGNASLLKIYRATQLSVVVGVADLEEG